MTFQETLQYHFSPTVRESLQTFLDVLQQHLSPTDWERLQTFIDSMNPERRAAMLGFIAQRGPTLRRSVRRHQISNYHGSAVESTCDSHRFVTSNRSR